MALHGVEERGRSADVRQVVRRYCVASTRVAYENIVTLFERRRALQPALPKGAN